MQERKCFSCGNWLPHILYSFVGYCCKRGEFSIYEFGCDSFIEVRVEGGFLWCETCKSFIESEEVREHIYLGHRIFRGIFLDPDYREEIYEG
ncbi:MAG: hypothetical protein N3D09_04505 [Archaeoglobaceae archaeon]|nr:hypothetical protein [Archaeoglobaceae archaeon]